MAAADMAYSPVLFLQSASCGWPVAGCHVEGCVAGCGGGCGRLCGGRRTFFDVLVQQLADMESKKVTT
ncbi:hypothetical protein J15TS10_43200 [Paenibacillus woosongensis]|uniref:Secreted protein n=1 Tax=Paenibacillus woosongensis TaxID=307580 RepID=A0ABQ4MX88_9BACL|nr:hypothetical protein J15TS10_43200 [Paenibacillus woosongensis]